MAQGFDLTKGLILLAAAVVVVPVAARLRVGSVLGYLVAGVMVGPWALGLIVAADDIRTLGDFGVVFLLFAVGLEMKVTRLWVMRRYVFGFGSAQVVVTTAALAGLSWGWGLSAQAAVVVGGALALSSTAVVLQTLTERGELTSRPGRVGFAVLLMQDLAVVPLLAFVAATESATTSLPSAMAVAALKAVGALAALVLAGRYLLRPVLRVVAESHSTEIFGAAALLVILGTGWLTAQVGLSMGLGAFLAGLMLAETEYRHQVEADILPFRGLLLGLFFMTVGMSADLGLLGREVGAVAAAVVGLLAIKAVLLAGLGRVFGFGAGVTLAVALLLAQGSEFGLVIVGLAQRQGLIPDDTAQSLALVVALTMVATPPLAALSAQIARRLGDGGPAPRLEDAHDLHDHVVIAGFGRVGQTVGRMLAARGIAFVALDLHSERVARGLAAHMAVYYGDATRPEVLRLAGAGLARAVVVTIDHAEHAEKVVASVRLNHPHVRVFARARDHLHGAQLRQAGATAAVPETLEASLQLGATVLRAGGLAGPDVARLVEDFRRDNYAKLGPLARVERDGAS